MTICRIRFLDLRLYLLLFKMMELWMLGLGLLWLHAHMKATITERVKMESPLVARSLMSDCLGHLMKQQQQNHPMIWWIKWALTLRSTSRYTVQWDSNSTVLVQVDWPWKLKIWGTGQMKWHTWSSSWLPLWFRSMTIALLLYLMGMHSGAQECQRMANKRHLEECHPSMSHPLGSSGIFFNTRSKLLI